MKHIYFIALFISYISFSQEYITPNKKISFGTHQHTNRDMSFFSKIDNQGNFIITGTTERDSTYTDILTTKLDHQMNLVWQKRYSVGNQLSYDKPITSYIGNNGNIYQISQTYDENNGYNGSNLYIVAYNADGEILWNTEFGICSYGTSVIDENDRLRIVYKKYNEDFTAENHYFITYNTDGSVHESFIKNNITDINTTDVSTTFSGFYYHSGFYYQIIQRYQGSSSSSVYNHFIRKISASETFTYSLDPYLFLTPPMNSTSDFYKGKFNIGNDGSMYYSFPMQNETRIRSVKITSSGEPGFSILTAQDQEKQLLASYINSDDNLCVVTNTNPVSQDINKTVTTDIYSANGTLTGQYSLPSTPVNGIAHYNDGTLLMLSGEKFWLTDEKLAVINEFNAPEINFGDFEKISDSSIIVANTSYEKMFPNSDYYSQLDIVVSKINADESESTYTYSGEGTSKIFGERLFLDNNNDYIVLSEDKLGEDNPFIGGATAPTKNLVTKYNANLDVLWSLELDTDIVNPYASSNKNTLIDSNNNIYILSKTLVGANYILTKISPAGIVLFETSCQAAYDIYLDNSNNICFVNITSVASWENDYNTTIDTYNGDTGLFINTVSFPGVSYLNNYKTNDGSSYIYFYDSRLYQENLPHKIMIYKNLVLQSTINLDISSQYDGISPFEFSKEGNAYFSTYQWPGINKVNKLDLSGTLSSAPTDQDLARLKIFPNGRVFTFHTEGHINIYNSDLTLHSATTLDNYSSDGLTMIEVKNQMLLNTYYNNRVIAINQEAEVTAEFKLPGQIQDQYAVTDANGNLVLTGTFGHQIQLEHAYQWRRGFLHVYDFDGILSTEDFSLPKTAELAIYPNPSSGYVTINPGERDSIKEIRIYDLSGRLLSQTKKSTVDISEYPAGIYLFKIETLNQNITKRVIKK